MERGEKVRQKLIEEYLAVTERMIDLQTADLKGEAVHVECRLSQRNRKSLRALSENEKIRNLLADEFYINNSGNLAESNFYTREYFTKLYWINTGHKKMAIHEILGGTVEPKAIFFLYGTVRKPETATDEHFKTAKTFMMDNLINALDNEQLKEEIQRNKRLLKCIEEAHEKQLSVII